MDETAAEQTAKKRIRKKKTRADIEVHYILLDGQELEAFSIEDAALYINRTPQALRGYIEKVKATPKAVRRFTLDMGNEVYIPKEDLDRLRVAHPVDD